MSPDDLTVLMQLEKYGGHREQQCKKKLMVVDSLVKLLW